MVRRAIQILTGCPKKKYPNKKRFKLAISAPKRPPIEKSHKISFVRNPQKWLGGWSNFDRVSQKKYHEQKTV